MDLLGGNLDREARRISVWILLQRKCRRNVDYIMEELRPIYSDLESGCKLGHFTLWRAFIYVFALGEVYGIRKDRARRAKRYE